MLMPSRVMRTVTLAAAMSALPGVTRAQEIATTSPSPAWEIEIEAPDQGHFWAVGPLPLDAPEALQARVEKGAVLGAISDPLGEDETLVRSPIDGVLIGRTNLPLANEGDALFHVASFRRTRTVAEEVETFREEVVADPELL